jgi:hypothetical protein
MFTIVPPNFRMLLLSCAGLIYNTWLSLWVSNKPSSPVKQKNL